MSLNDLIKTQKRLRVILLICAILMLGLAAFFIYLILVCFFRKYRTEARIFIILILLSMLLSLVVFSVIIAYNDISSCPTINIGYMVGGYGLMAAWEALTLVFSWQFIAGIWKAKMKMRPEDKGRGKETSLG